MLVTAPELTDHADRSVLRTMLEDGPFAGSVYRTPMMQAAEQADVLHRTARPGHFTGSAFVVDATATKTLMLFHTKLQRWLQPGGHADGNANMASVALREAQEETGIEGLRVDPEPIDLDVHRVEPPAEDAHDHLDVRFLVVAPADAVVVGNHESQGLRWVSNDDLVALGVDDGLIRMASRGFERARSYLPE